MKSSSTATLRWVILPSLCPPNGMLKSLPVVRYLALTDGGVRDGFLCCVVWSCFWVSCSFSLSDKLHNGTTGMAGILIVDVHDQDNGARLFLSTTIASWQQYYRKVVSKNKDHEVQLRHRRFRQSALKYQGRQLSSMWWC